MEQSEVQKSDKNDFARKKPSLQKVGEFLREARQGRSLSIEDLASSLRIGKEQLLALESGDEDSLPEKVFIRAMVRRIAEKLNLDTNYILEELNEKKENEANYRLIPNKEKQKKSKKLNPILLVILPGALGLITSILTLKYLEQNQDQSINTPMINIYLSASNYNKDY